ncbi:MAG: endonuclease III [Candidatus Micrarchaeia archaeon]
MVWQGNEKFMSHLGYCLRIMEKQGRALGAPVYALEDNSKESPFKILVYTMLSARTRDDATTTAARNLFEFASTPSDIAAMPVGRIASLIKPVGFYKVKARNLKNLCTKLLEKFNGGVPDTFEGLVLLPGVGVKTANVVLARAFNHDVIGVDTHVHRISNRLGLVKTKTPEETGKLLNTEIPKKYRNRFNKVFVGFGQTVCKPIAPKCAQCKILKFCRRVGVSSL